MSSSPLSSVDPATYFVMELRDESDTDQFGARLATVLEPGLVIALIGPLGAGKTRLVRAVATGLGAAPQFVNSPTFVLIQEYEARIPIFHFDTYRLPDVAAFADLGADEYFHGDGLCFVEWANRVAEFLPTDHLRLSISVTGPTSRHIELHATGPKSQAVIDRLKAAPQTEPSR